MILIPVLDRFYRLTRLPLLYSLAVGCACSQSDALLGDHHLTSDGGELSFHDHILDSCNYTSRDLGAWLFCPFAIRYHAARITCIRRFPITTCPPRMIISVSTCRPIRPTIR